MDWQRNSIDLYKTKSSAFFGAADYLFIRHLHDDDDDGDDDDSSSVGSLADCLLVVFYAFYTLYIYLS